MDKSLFYQSFQHDAEIEAFIGKLKDYAEKSSDGNSIYVINKPLGEKKYVYSYEKVYSQGSMYVMEIWVDKETGVNYLYHASGYSGGMTPLLDREGKPVVAPVINR